MDTTYAKDIKLEVPKRPTYRQCDYYSYTPEDCDDIYQIRDVVLAHLASNSIFTYKELMPELKFKILASRVEEDCYFTASPTKIAMHPAYQEIIGMGSDALPYLIKELDNRPTFWFWALEAITGAKPVKKEHRGLIKEMVRDWKSWFKENVH